MKKILFLSALSTACAWAFAGNLVVSVLDKEGKPVADAVVVVIPANKTALPKTALPQRATINQEKMQFIPSVTLLPVGAKVSFVNNDPFIASGRLSTSGRCDPWW